MSAVLTDAAYQERVRELLARATAIVPRMRAIEDDPASDELTQVLSELNEVVLDVTYPEPARERADRALLERQIAAIAQGGTQDLLDRLERRARRLAASLGSGRVPAGLLRMEAEMLVSATLDIIYRIPFEVWRVEPTPVSSTGQRPDVAHVLAMFRAAAEKAMP
jgi:hypothetical protein